MLILTVPSWTPSISKSFFVPVQKKFTTQSAFILHAAWLDQASAHCPIFLTAASRRSWVRVGVLVNVFVGVLVFVTVFEGVFVGVSDALGVCVTVLVCV